MPKLRRIQGPRYIGGAWIYGGQECGSQRHGLVVPARWCRTMPHEWRQPTRARIGIPWWPWQARWRTRLGARFLLQFKQPLDKPSQGGIIEQRIPHCSTVERTIARSARAHGARDQLGAQRIAFAPQEQRGALRQLRVLGAQLRRRQQRGGLASSVGHWGPKHSTGYVRYRGTGKKTPGGRSAPLYCKTQGSREPGTQYRYSTVVCVPAPPSVFELYPLCPVCVPAPPSDFLPVPVPVRNVFVPCPVCVPAPHCVFLPVPAPPGVFLPVRGRPLLSRPRGAVGPGPAAVESAAASVVALTCGVCVVGGFRWL